jgi:hypothetical protein
VRDMKLIWWFMCLFGFHAPATKKIGVRGHGHRTRIYRGNVCTRCGKILNMKPLE